MNCGKFRQEISLAMTSERFEPDRGILSHIDSCENCAVYYAELSRLRESLNGQVFEVLPGELDDITLEKIIGNKYRPKHKSRRFNFFFSGYRRWAIAPVAAIVIVVLMNLVPRYRSVTDESMTLMPGDSYDWSWSELVSLAEDNGFWPIVVETFIEDNTEFDFVADEIPFEFEDALESLTDEELNILYERIDKLNGSAS